MCSNNFCPPKFLPYQFVPPCLASSCCSVIQKASRIIDDLPKSSIVFIFWSLNLVPDHNAPTTTFLISSAKSYWRLSVFFQFHKLNKYFRSSHLSNFTSVLLNVNFRHRAVLLLWLLLYRSDLLIETSLYQSTRWVTVFTLFNVERIGIYETPGITPSSTCTCSAKLFGLLVPNRWEERCLGWEQSWEESNCFPNLKV